MTNTYTRLHLHLNELTYIYCTYKENFLSINVQTKTKCDENHQPTSQDPLHALVRSSARSRTKKIKNAFNRLIQDI
jgi:hypothetical protein